MKHLRPLVKMELRHTVLMMIYFVLIGIISIVSVEQSIQSIIVEELTYGIRRAFEYQRCTTRWGDLFRENIQFYTIAAIVGMLILIYISYRHDKNHEMSRFLKSLPYTVQERYLVKVTVGTSLFTICYVLYSIAMIISRTNYLNQTKDIYEVTVLSGIYPELFSSSQLIKLLLVVYVKVMACYFIGIFFEYIISVNFASLLIAVLVTLSPLFIILSIEWRISRGGYIPIWDEIVNYVYATIVGGLNYANVVIETGILNHNNIYFNYMDLFGARIGTFLIIIAVCIGLTLKLCKSHRLETADILIPSKVFRGIFIIGVTVCTSLLASDLYYIYSGSFEGMSNILALLGGISGLLIAWKIAHIGIRKERSKVLEEVTQ